MKILRSYALRELVVPFCVALLVFTFIFIVGNLVKMADLIVNKGVDSFDIIRIIILLIPGLLSFTLPTSVLTAVLLVFGQMAQNNEIIAIKANGINIFKFVLPVLLSSILISLFALILNDQILPKTHFAYRKALKSILIKQPLAYLEAGRFIKEFKNYVIFVREIDGNVLRNITIYQPAKDRPTRTIIAEWGEIISDPETKTLALKLYNGTSDEPNPDDPTVFYKLDFETFVLPPFALYEGGENISKKTKDMTIDELVRELKEKNPQLQGLTNLFNKLRAELHKKVSFSFASFVFVLIGLPLAMITRRSETIVSFGLSLVVITVYYVLFAWANTVAVQGIIPPSIALWLPNIIMIICGSLLMYKAVNT